MTILPKIVLTGGGTAGHVMPNLAILDELRASGFEVHYIGSGGIEKELITNAGVPFHQISTGKLRRYFSVQNFLDIFRLTAGFIQALAIMLKLKPAIVFSKGGFVAVPVTLAAWICRIPVVAHESDYSPGLANRIIAPFSSKILYTFPETAASLPAGKAIHVGTPVRKELFAGSAARGIKFCGFDGNKPILLVMGGSQGAQRINDALKEILPTLVHSWSVVHLTGKGKTIGYSNPSYRAFEFVGDELKDIFAASNFVVSRAGANSIFELLALKKPMLLIPLEFGSRGDQVLNAKSFVANGWAHSVSETTMTGKSLLEAVDNLQRRGKEIADKQAAASIDLVPNRIVKILLESSGLS